MALCLAPAGRAAMTASVSGPTVTAQASGGADTFAVRWVPGGGTAAEHGITQPAYTFSGGFTGEGFAMKDQGVSPGAGCFYAPDSGPETPQPVVACPSTGITEVDVNMGDGDDFVNAGNGRDLPGTFVIRGGTGNDGLFSDAKGTAQHELFGEEGSDGLSAFSPAIRARMDGGPGNDRFSWETTTRGVPTSADGGPGDDKFSADNARGPETISGGAGVDDIDVYDGGSGDRDTVACGDGFDALIADPTDAVAADCEPAPTEPRINENLDADAHAAQATLRRATLRTIAARGLTLGMRGRFAGTYSAQLIADTSSSRSSAAALKRIASATRTITRPKRIKLTLRLTRAGRALARRSPRLRLRVQVTHAVKVHGEVMVRYRTTGATVPR